MNNAVTITDINPCSQDLGGEALAVELVYRGRAHQAIVMRDHTGRYTTTWANSLDLWLSDSDSIDITDAEAIIDAVQSAVAS